MTADVFEGAQFRVFAQYDEDTVAANLPGNEVARLLQLIDMSDPLPGLQEERVIFEFKKFRIGIGPWQQWRARCLVVQSLILFFVHR